MQDVVQISTTHMSDADLHAIAVYLKSLPASQRGEPTPAPAPQISMRQGQAIYVDQCAACHAVDGTGSPGLFPSLKGSSGVQSERPTTALHAILAGAQSASTAYQPSAPSMPAYAWKLSDGQIAAVATYVRNAWGNAAPPVSVGEVESLRKHVAAHPINRPKAKV
jgi:mono/diheme cytochrome c family protein